MLAHEKREQRRNAVLNKRMLFLKKFNMDLLYYPKTYTSTKQKT